MRQASQATRSWSRPSRRADALARRRTIAPALARWLCDRGHDASTAAEVGLRDADDRVTLSYAALNDAVVVTKDEDFIRLRAPGDHPRVLWVRIGNAVNRILLARFEEAWPQIEAHLEHGAPLIELR